MNPGDPIVTKRHPDRVAFVIPAALAILAAVIAVSTYKMAGPAGNGQVGPRTFPYVIAAALFGLAIWSTVAAWRGEFPAREKQELGPVFWIIGGLAAQMLLLKFAGFSIATGLLFAATARGFGRGPIWFTIPIGIILAFGLWIVFAKGLQLSLPAGPIERALF
jgi:putative tricarboxylic transport membrane protein